MELKREIDPVLLAALSKPMFYPVALVHVDWPDAPIRVHSGVGDIAHAGAVFKGLGGLGGLQVPGEDVGLVSGEAVLEITGPLIDVLDDVAEDRARNRLVQIWVGASTTPGGNTLIGVPFPAFYGAVNRNNFKQTGRDLARLEIGVKSGPRARSKARITHSQEDQQVHFPGDTLFRRTAHAQKWRSNPPTWPAT